MKKTLEWFGVVTAIIYSMLVASNTGYEVIGFTLLFISALAIGLWAFLCKHYGILLLQFFTQVQALLVCGAGCKVVQSERERLNDTPPSRKTRF